MKRNVRWWAVALTAAAALGASQPAAASDRTVKLAVSSYQEVLAGNLERIAACKGTSASARRCRATQGARLVVSTRTAAEAARRAAAAGAGACVRAGLDVYQRGLNQYAAVGRALQRNQVARANTISRQAARSLKAGTDRVLGCAAAPPPTTTG
jgi:hypothetical protein